MALNLQTSFYFSVSISGMGGSDAAFQEVSGLSKEMGIEEVVCGGENRFTYRLPAHTTFQNLVLRRGVLNAESALISWVKDTLDNGVSVPIKTRDIKVWLLNENGEVSMDWNFIAAYPVKWSASNLKSQESEILIETLEFAYQYFEMPNFETFSLGDD
ncbi:phage tail protein [Dickeya dianthicola]|uniref:phage tail protein n=1 Tax=Dickeya dianthicola TaxID=204039 RepID=UPI003016930C